MENKKGSSIFLGVIGVATLIVAIIGATFAYFSASIETEEDVINVGSTEIKLEYTDTINSKFSTKLIPATEVIASYGGLNQSYITTPGEVQCVDDKGNEICSIYEITIINESTAAADLTASLNVVNNGFTNLKYKIYAGTTKKDTTEGTKQQTDATLINYVTTADGSAQDTENSVGELLVDATKFGATGSKTTLTALSGVLQANTKKTYTMLIWIEEMAEENEADQGVGLTAGLTFTSANGSGVTGVIGAMNTQV